MLVVVADKDPYVLDAARSALAGADSDVLTASDGPETVRLVRENLPDVVVVASSLGHMGGFALARDLKTFARAGEFPEPKIVVLLERQADTWLAAWSGCDTWATKPVEVGELRRMVREAAGLETQTSDGRPAPDVAHRSPDPGPSAAA